MMYRCPGELRHITRGFLYDQRQHADADKAKAEGWFDSLEEAAGLVPPAPESMALPFVPVDDDAPPTRAEMIAQAEKLGIDVDKRWGDKRLMAEIDKATEAKDAA
jgi:hypothetical protein